MNNIIVLGCGRSGTSLIAGSIATSDQKYNFGGKLNGPDRFNEKGYFETNVISSINDSILWSCKNVETTQGIPQGWLSVLDSSIKIDNCTDIIKDKILSVTKNQPYLFKDPRFSYTLPVWLPYLQNCKFICVFRNPSEFIQSVSHNCQTAEYLKGIIINKGYIHKIWTSTYNYILNNYSHLNICYVNSNQFIKGFGAKMLSDFVGHEINRNFADKELMHFTPDNLNLSLDNKSTEIYNQLCCLADCPEELK